MGDAVQGAGPGAGGTGAAGRAVMEMADRYLMPTYRRHPLVAVRGEGCWLWDADGTRYLDMVAGIGVVGVGHCHPRVVEAVARQAAELMHCSNLYYIEPQARLARWLVEHSPFDRAFFCNSGTEAVEAAIKLARRHARNRGRPGSFEIVAAFGSFHGRTMGSLSATGQSRHHEGFEPLVPGFRFVPFNDVGALERAVTPATAAILLEPVQGEGGVHPARPEFLRAARELAERWGCLLIFDEVQCGLGRTGRLFAFEHFGVVPDVVTLAKALGGGVAIGAVLARGPAAVAFSPGQHAATFGGNPLACRAALAALSVIEEEGLVARAERMGAYLQGRLVEMARKVGSVREVRGLGLMVAVELEVAAREVAAACQRRGVLVNAVSETALRLLPPLVIGEPEIDLATAALGEAIREVAGTAAGSGGTQG